MTTALQVAHHILETHGAYGRVHLLKLVYYSQAWSLAWEGPPMFNDRVEAWSMGPVVPPVYGVLRHVEGGVPPQEPLTAREAAIVNSVLDYYGHVNGTQLSRLTHNEAPWLDARAGIPDGAFGDRVIPQASMRRYYTTEAIVGRGPIRPVMDELASLQTVLDHGLMQAQHWSKTLELLAQ